MPFIDDITCTIFDMSSNVYDITLTICVTSHNACISDITHSIFMIYTLYMASHTVLWLHNHCVTSQPLCIISHTLYMSSHTVDQFYQTQCMYDITPTMSMTSYADFLYMTSHPRFMTSHTLYLWHHSHYIGNITPTVFVNTYQLYLTWKTLL